MIKRTIINQKIYDYVLEHINSDSIDQDLNIFSTGLVSSLFSIELMTFVEKMFTIKVTMNDLNMSNFHSINNITNFVFNKLNRN